MGYIELSALTSGPRLPSVESGLSTDARIRANAVAIDDARNATRAAFATMAVVQGPESWRMMRGLVGGLRLLG
jgi:hypothetical protein